MRFSAEIFDSNPYLSLPADGGCLLPPAEPATSAVSDSASAALVVPPPAADSVVSALVLPASRGAQLSLPCGCFARATLPHGRCAPWWLGPDEPKAFHSERGPVTGR